MQNLGTVSALATMGTMIVAGDATGSLHFWDMKSKHHKAFVTQRGAISPIVFAPSSAVSQEHPETTLLGLTPCDRWQYSLEVVNSEFGTWISRPENH